MVLFRKLCMKKTFSTLTFEHINQAQRSLEIYYVDISIDKKIVNIFLNNKSPENVDKNH